MVYSTESKTSETMTSPLFSSSSLSSPPSRVCSSNNNHHPSPYLERVGEALSRALSNMEPYDNIRVTSESIIPQSSCVVRPHVELGTAPVAVERIQDSQKVHRPFRVGGSSKSTSAATGGSWTTRSNTSSNKKGKGNIAKGTSTTTARTATNTSSAISTKTNATRESCLIESTSNSVRISFLFKAQAKAQAANANANVSANADTLEASILFQWMRFLMVQHHHPLLRKRPLEGYSITFLVTNQHLAVHKNIKESILSFCSRIDKECSDIKLQVNAQARYVTTEFCKAFNQ